MLWDGHLSSHILHPHLLPPVLQQSICYGTQFPPLRSIKLWKEKEITEYTNKKSKNWSTVVAFAQRKQSSQGALHRCRLPFKAGWFEVALNVVALSQSNWESGWGELAGNVPFLCVLFFSLHFTTIHFTSAPPPPPNAAFAIHLSFVLKWLLHKKFSNQNGIVDVNRPFGGAMSVASFWQEGKVVRCHFE